MLDSVGKYLSLQEALEDHKKDLKSKISSRHVQYSCGEAVPSEKRGTKRVSDIDVSQGEQAVKGYMSTVSVAQNSDQSDSLSCPSELDFSLQPLRACTPHTSSISSSSKSSFENSESRIRPEISVLSESSSIEKAPIAEQSDISGSMAAQGDVGSMAEQGDLSGSMAEQGDLSGPIAEQGDVSGPIAEQGDVSGPIPEQGDVSGPIAEQGDVSGPISEQGDVSGPIPEQGDVSGPIPEQSDVSGPIAEQGDVSGLHSDVVDVGEGDDEKETWPGFKRVGDNIDKTIKPRDMRINNQANSVHYFNVYAVGDRINFSHLSSNAGYDGGTLFHLRNVINRRIVVTNVKKDLNSCEEFMELVTTAHVLSAAIEITKLMTYQAYL
eukprot:Em0007g1311a